jgi:ATP-dependent Clp protease ATP-binding subunit ClpB
VGYEEGGQLTEAVRRRPHAVILFDEIEKAHADVFNVLLQILDDGRLTDSQGRTVDFRNAVVIMTSNIGSGYILEHAGRSDWEDVQEVVTRQLHQHFRPEFLNRVDDVIVFTPLGPDEIRQIVDLQLARVEKLTAELGIVLEVSEAARDHLARVGYDPAYGARPLKRVIQRQVQDPLALYVLDAGVGEGERIRVDVSPDGNSLSFEPVKGETPREIEATETARAP